MLVRNQEKRKSWASTRPAPISQMPGCPRGTPKLAIWSRCQMCDLRFPLAPCGQRAVFQMWPPPLFTCVVPVDASSHALANVTEKYSNLPGSLQLPL